ncbi:MAG: DUF2306 domain-containing protein [Porticoccaceae bacterium]|nr:DUF2306 domain-containing protein [Porticoccaceae bacterium]
MTYLQLTYLHLGTIAPAFFIASFLLLRGKGTPFHKRLGKVYMSLMIFTSVVSLFMSAQVGPQFLGHFGYIHLLSVIALISVPVAYFAIRKGDVKNHASAMIGLYVGGLLIAGGFTLMPGRLLNTWIFG